MKRLDFDITINAPREKVWSILWNETTYPKWTAAFSENSQVRTDWKKGSKAIFTDGSQDGMVATIAENIPNSFMSIKHMGALKDGKEDFTSAEKEGWSGALENYTLTAENGGTQLHIEMDSTDEHADMFRKMWPEALNNVKKLAEAK